MSNDMNKYSGPRSPEILKVGEQVLNVVVDHQAFRSIRDACRDLIHTMRTLRSPSGILIFAEPGMGKTLLLGPDRPRVLKGLRSGGELPENRIGRRDRSTWHCGGHDPCAGLSRTAFQTDIGCVEPHGQYWPE